MSNWSLGSVRNEVHTLIPSIPVSISGAPIDRIADRARLFMEEQTGLSIGSVGIAEKYQPALLHLTCADVLEMMDLVGVDATDVRLGEFSISKGSSSNISVVKENFRKQGMQELGAIGLKVSFYQAL